MTPEERIIQLERELIETRNAAAALILGVAEGITSTPWGREELAASFEAAASDADEATRRLARLVASALRRNMAN